VGDVERLADLVEVPIVRQPVEHERDHLVITERLDRPVHIPEPTDPYEPRERP